MSAIFGIYYLDGKPVAKSELEKMSSALSHRGRDDDGVWTSGSVGLGHRMRWTTPESLSETLPFTDKAAASGVTITADARIDNRDDVCDALGMRNSEDITDSEIVLKAYLKWGRDCPAHLIGDYVFAIWDPEKNELFLARDPLGIKHFYYYYQPGKVFAIASEIKALLKLGEVRAELDEESLSDNLILNTENKESTFYKDIYRLPATHALRISGRGLKKWKYWQPTSREIRLANDREYHEAFREKFTEAVRCRLRSNFKIGSTLSGGLDSSAVVCVASELLKRDGRPVLETFSGIFPDVAEIDPRIDERRYMESVVDRSGCNPNFLVVDRVNPLHDLDKILDHTDQPMGHLNVFMGYEIFKAAAAKDVRVLLSGHDGDCTVSYGYEDFELLARRGRFIRLFQEALALRKNMPHHPQHNLRYLAWDRGIRPTIPDPVVSAWRTLRRRKPPVARSPVYFPLHFDAISTEFKKKFDLPERLERFGKLSYPDDQSRAEHHWSVLTNGLFASMHEQGEKLAGAYGIEQRHPFFDRRLIEFCGQLPPGQRLYRGWTRSIFRYAMQDVLPTDVQWRTDKARLGEVIKTNMFKYKSKDLEKITRPDVEKLSEYINVDKLRAVYQSCLASPRKKEQEVLLVLTSSYLLNWFERYQGAHNN
jgi:asparagine synthase (glutamine-hydrolysing)